MFIEILVDIESCAPGFGKCDIHMHNGRGNDFGGGLVLFW